MEKHCKNALLIAKFLDKHEKVSWVSYAGLIKSKFNKLAKKYMSKGVGPVFTFGIIGGMEAGKKLINNLEIFSMVENVKLLSHVANVGDTRSLILHPASTTHNQLSKKEKDAAGAGPDVIRISVGIENHKDLINDLKKALKNI